MTDITTLKKSLLMIQKLKKLLQEQHEKLFEPIAIIGMGCRLPEANNPHEFWDLLCQGKNVITSIPDERWELLNNTAELSQRDANLAYSGGYLRNIAEFDAYFFGLSPREAMRMDPQQRLLLEVSYEALEDAGLTVDALAGSNMGVFSSLYASQFSHLQQLDSDMDALLIPTGSAISMAANRLSYLLDLHGPSIVLDTACSSSLIAVQLACLNLQAKLCDKALVSAVNINLLPSLHSVLAKATMLSPTGQCNTFDAAADGYVQGEGVGAIVLKTLSQALRDKDRIQAVITGSAVNQDGKTNGLTAPNGLQQEQLLHLAYHTAKTDPSLVSYIECHGTGTFLGDPIEVEALGEVVGKQREAQKPCWISSVKTNVGHLEPAAGIISMIKTVLILKHGTIPPHLNFTTPNPHIPFDKYKMNIPKKMEKLPRYGEVSIAGVSGFGFGGANAHIVLREVVNTEQSIASPTTLMTDGELFTLSAKDPFALQDLISLWCDYLKNNQALDFAQLCYNVHLRRSHYAQRCAVVAHSTKDLHQKLVALGADYHGVHQGIFINHEIKKSNNRTRIAEFDGVDLSVLAEQYVNHAAIDWKQYEAGRFYPHLDMPLYPWQHKKYWPVLGYKGHDAVNTAYPMRGRTLSSPLSARQFEFGFDTKALPEIQDTFYVLHAGYYTEMLSYAVEQLHQTNCFKTENLRFFSPLLVLDGKSVSVQLIIAPNEHDSLSFSFYSNDGKENWIEHASGILSLQSTAKEQIDSQEDLIKRSLSSGTMESFCERIIGMGMPAGDTIRWTQEYWVGQKEIFCELRAPKHSERGEQFIRKMHPGIIDACIQTLFLLLPAQFNKPYIASHMGNIEFYEASNEPRYIYAKLKELHPEGKKIIGDWYLLDKNKCLIAKCIDLCMTQLNDTMQIDKIMATQSQFQLDLSLPFGACKNQLMQYLTEQFATIFSMPVNDVSIHHSLHELGMDSLMALAVMRIIEANLGVTYSLPLMMKGPSIHDIAEYVLAEKLQKEKAVISMVTTDADKIWLANRKIKADAQVRLFCFPYGGGGASIYREWQQNFPDFIEVCPVQLPGRENRMGETPIENLDTLIPLLAQHLQSQFDLPFAFFGHSFGSLIGFELTRYLRRHHLSLPAHLFVSAYPDPRAPSKSLNNLLAQLEQMNLNLFDLNQELISKLTEKQLMSLSKVFKDNGVVDYSDERMNQSIIQVLLPIFIGDMKMVKNYVYHEEAPLKLTNTVFLGTQDTWVAPEEHWGWVNHVDSCEFQEFDSGHLFVREKEIRLKIIKKITAELMRFSEVACETEV